MFNQRNVKKSKKKKKRLKLYCFNKGNEIENKIKNKNWHDLIKNVYSRQKFRFILCSIK